MSETNYATGGFRRITRLVLPVKMRLFGFMLVVVCGTLLMAWLTRTTWNQLDRLQKEHAAVKSESFYLGVTLRSAIRSLNSKLLQFGLTHEPAVRDAFSQEAKDLRAWMETNRVHLTEVVDLRLLRRVGLSRDLEMLQKAETSYEQYLAQSAKILAEGKPPADLDTFEEIYAQVQRASRDLLQYCDELVAVQGKGFSEFLTETQRTLINHQRLLKLSSALILALAGTLAVLVYRGMIAPLRLGLTQSKTIIERQEKLASLGVLASGVAHEIRNPLTAIKIRLFSLKKAIPAVATNEDATVIADEINRLERIVKDFLQFARPSEPELTKVSAGQLLQDVAMFLKESLGRSAIDLQAEAEGSAWVYVDAQQIKQVMINLIQNAAEAIGRNGQISLGLRRTGAELEG
ncbi:MAG TPA: histidine kinase dimerization/phospho-acceptor domain-containing protein, partial [Candidatus Sulfotelmatobacter sp.]|nr:histidine kinase dimerization/phospho-acceptor domain-containing protein [Candidatus Sulfotelmatobacter sp.]